MLICHLLENKGICRFMQLTLHQFPQTALIISKLFKVHQINPGSFVMHYDVLESSQNASFLFNFSQPRLNKSRLMQFVYSNSNQEWLTDVWILLLTPEAKHWHMICEVPAINHNIRSPLLLTSSALVCNTVTHQTEYDVSTTNCRQAVHREERFWPFKSAMSRHDAAKSAQTCGKLFISRR